MADPVIIPRSQRPVLPPSAYLTSQGSLRSCRSRAKRSLQNASLYVITKAHRMRTLVLGQTFHPLPPSERLHVSFASPAAPLASCSSSTELCQEHKSRLAVRIPHSCEDSKSRPPIIITAHIHVPKMPPGFSAPFPRPPGHQQPSPLHSKPPHSPVPTPSPPFACSLQV